MKDAYSYQLTPEQFAQAALRRSRRLVRSPTLRFVIMAAGAGFFGAVGYLLAAATGSRSIPSSTVEIALAVMAVSLIVSQSLTVSAMRRALLRSRYMCRPRTLRIEANGLRLAGDDSENFLGWPEISGAEIERDMLYLQMDAVSYYAIPVAAFGSGEEAREFAELVRRRAGGSASHEAQMPLRLEGAAAHASGTALMRHRRAAAVGSVKDALRLAFFLRLPEGRPAGSWGGVFACALIGMAVPIATAFVVVGTDGEWNWYGLAYALFHVPLLLAAAILVGYAIGRSTEVPRMMMAGLLVFIVVGLAGALGSIAFARFPWWGAAAAWIGPLWIALALATFAGRFVDPGRRRALALASCIALVAIPLGSIPHDGSMWYQRYDADEDSGTRDLFGPAAEDVFYKQPALLTQELRALRPASADRTNVFFIGMAGYGSQNVFRREVDSVERIFRERFGAQGHTVRLINNPRTLLDVPIASATSLKASLNRVAQLMDKDRDVLVLYMTSHGSQDHRFSLSLWPLSFHEIDPAALRAMLDESGIRNRVIIIAACYSGGFVKPLASPDTLVITAAAADRTSFGCSNEADWTYFGKAYFDEALRRTHSFTRAFEIARPRIEERERKDGFDPSNPQISVGANIAVKLRELERQLDGARGDGHLRFASAAARAPDKYDEYVRVMFTAEYADELRAACEANMALAGPEATLAQHPGVFDGMERSPAHWRKLNAAWSEYATRFCAQASDAKTIRDVYESKVRANVSPASVEAALAFLRTSQGARWIRADREAARQETLELGRIESDLNKSLYARYLGEQGAIFADFRSGKR